MILIIFLAGFLFFSNTVYGDHNTTVDDTNTSIAYRGQWGEAQWPLAYGGSHAFADTDNNPDASASIATFTFTGIAFYYMAPLWPYTVNTVVTIDSGNPNLVDMTDHSSSAPVGSGPTVQSQVLWGKSGLANTEHTVVFSMVNGGRYVVVDALVYTVFDPSPTAVLGPSSTPMPSPVSTPSSASTSASTTQRSNSNLGLITGAVCGVLGFALAVALFLLCRRHQKSIPQETNRSSIASYRQPPMSNPEYGYVPPIPSALYASMSEACLMCHSAPKNGVYDFCGWQCRDLAMSTTHLLEAPPGHVTYRMVESKFISSWNAPQNKPCPPVRKVLKILESPAMRVPYDAYRLAHGNECFRYHGTTRECNLGEAGNLNLCESATCSLCSILATSFKVSLARPGGAFGQGVYTSSASNKAASYSPTGAMLLTKVTLGNVYQATQFNEVMSCPPGYNSVVFDRYNGRLNETTVYTNDAIRPVFLILFG